MKTPFDPVKFCAEYESQSDSVELIRIGRGHCEGPVEAAYKEGWNAAIEAAARLVPTNLPNMTTQNNYIVRRNIRALKMEG